MLTTKKPDNPEPIESFDPWPEARSTAERQKTVAPPWPVWWPLLSVPARQTIGGHALALLAQHPMATARDDAARLAHVLWGHIRAIKPDGKNSVDEELNQPHIGTTPTLHLAEVLRALLDGGSLLENLRRRRDALTEQIGKLDYTATRGLEA